MKKKIRIVVLVCLALFLFSYYKTNAGKPHDLKVKKYEFGQKITYEDFDFTVDKGEIFVNMDRDMIPIIYTVKNKKSEKTNAAKLLLRIAYRNGLSNDEICQNFIEPSFPQILTTIAFQKSTSLMILSWSLMKKKLSIFITLPIEFTMKNTLPA